MATATRAKSCEYRLKKSVVHAWSLAVPTRRIGVPRRHVKRRRHCEAMLKAMNYRTHIVSSLSESRRRRPWDALVAGQADANPFLSYAFLHALHESGSASARDRLAAAVPGAVRTATCWPPPCPCTSRCHSYGEYVFDWAWADAYQRNGLDYYPKLLSAIPFTPVTGTRLLARDDAARAALIEVLTRHAAGDRGLVDPHPVSRPRTRRRQLEDAGFLLRSGVQFHWLNPGYARLRRIPGHAGAKKAQEHPRRAAQGARSGRDAAPRARGATPRDADWRAVQPLLPQHLRGRTTRRRT